MQTKNKELSTLAKLLVNLINSSNLKEFLTECDQQKNILPTELLFPQRITASIEKHAVLHPDYGYVADQFNRSDLGNELFLNSETRTIAETIINNPFIWSPGMFLRLTERLQSENECFEKYWVECVMKFRDISMQEAFWNSFFSQFDTYEVFCKTGYHLCNAIANAYEESVMREHGGHWASARSYRCFMSALAQRVMVWVKEDNQPGAVSSMVKSALAVTHNNPWMYSLLMYPLHEKIQPDVIDQAIQFLGDRAADRHRYCSWGLIIQAAGVITYWITWEKSQTLASVNALVARIRTIGETWVSHRELPTKKEQCVFTNTNDTIKDVNDVTTAIFHKTQWTELIKTVQVSEANIDQLVDLQLVCYSDKWHNNLMPKNRKQFDLAISYVRKMDEKYPQCISDWPRDNFFKSLIESDYWKELPLSEIVDLYGEMVSEVLFFWILSRTDDELKPWPRFLENKWMYKKLLKGLNK